jgi:hypothetical protein
MVAGVVERKVRRKVEARLTWRAFKRERFKLIITKCEKGGRLTKSQGHELAYLKYISFRNANEVGNPWDSVTNLVDGFSHRHHKYRAAA